MLTINEYFLSQSTEMTVYHKALKWLFITKHWNDCFSFQNWLSEDVHRQISGAFLEVVLQSQTLIFFEFLLEHFEWFILFVL